MDAAEIRSLFERHSVPLERDDVWKVQSAVVVKHKALERLAGGLRIVWDPPVIIRAERDEAVILATGRLSDGPAEWSIGECLQTDGTAPGNYRVSGKQAPYVYAMAEKRAKDRVILKLAGLHGAYSEDEADDFSGPADVRSVMEQSAKAPAGNVIDLQEVVAYLARAESAVANIDTASGLVEWWRSESGRRNALGITKETQAYADLAKLCADRDTEIVDEVTGNVRAG